MNNEKETFLRTWEQEFATTLKVLKAFPHDKQDLKPAPISRSAKELAWVFADEERVMVAGVASGNIDWTSFQPAPATIKDAIAAYEKNHAAIVEKVRSMSDADWQAAMPFYVAPKVAGNVRRADILWIALHDQIHHRGQFSVYLRLAGGKVPSIYGPTADEVWN